MVCLSQIECKLYENSGVIYIFTAEYLQFLKLNSSSNKCLFDGFTVWI